MAQLAKDSPLTKGAQVGAEVTALLRARYGALWISTVEEGRAESILVESAGRAKLGTWTWDGSAGFCDERGRSTNEARDPTQALDFIRNTRDRRVYVLRDFHAFLGDPFTRRAFRNLCKYLQTCPLGEQRAIVVLSYSREIPPELADHVTQIDLPLPERSEIASILDTVLAAQGPEIAASAAPNGTRDASVDAASGLSAEKAGNCYSKSLVTRKATIDPVLVAGEKKRMVQGQRGITWIDPDVRGLDAFAGGDLLVQWTIKRRPAFSSKARAFGLPAPKGILLVGPPGTGKTLFSKCVATVLGCPLLKADLGGQSSKYVGESESNVRGMFAFCDAAAPCVVQFDEVEKSLKGATGEQGDGGVSSDRLGVMLSWMQDHSAPVFVVATANDVRALPPEFLRKGRFDEIFFVDLPTLRERAAVLDVTLRAVTGPAIDGATIDTLEVARACAGFSGAELAALVPDAMFSAFADGGRAITTHDLLDAASTVVPVSRSAADKIQALRDWAKINARPASSPESEGPAVGRALDL